MFGCIPRQPVICAASAEPLWRSMKSAAPIRIPLVKASPAGTNVVSAMTKRASQLITGKSGSDTRSVIMRASDSPKSRALVACAYAKFFAL